MVRPLREWVYTTLREAPAGIGIGEDRIVERLTLRLDLVLPDVGAREGEGLGSGGAVTSRFLAYDTSVDLLLDVVDAVLNLLSALDDLVRIPWRRDGRGAGVSPGAEAWVTGRRSELDRLLGDALSVLRVQPDGRGLERRSDALAELALGEASRSAEAVPSTGSAVRQLREAWGCVYALHPDPVKGYSQAIKAVESAALAVVEPHNAKATLGTMLGHLKANRGSFSLVIGGPGGMGDVAPLIENMKLLWEGQTSRHGSSRPTREETLGEAEMAVHLAVMLVHWFTSGAVRRSPDL
jgi:hypothetical protein